MQQPSYLDDLHYIIDSVNIDADGQLIFQGKPYAHYDYPELTTEARLFHNLNSLLYTACYTRSSKTDAAEAPDFGEEAAFLTSLRTANASVEGYDCGWRVEEIEPGGNILVRKSGNKRYTYAGDFIREHFGQGPLQKGELVNIRVLPDYSGDPAMTDAFYFVFGETLLDNNNSAVVRIYFNITPAGAAPLIGLISNTLNRYCIPFQFKCLNRPGLYTRCDPAVLYLDKRYFQLVGDLLSEAYATLSAELHPVVPMFTRTLAPGIGFAENPLAAAESFGTSRCKIIAQGIIEAWKDQRPKEKWLDFILQNIQKNYLRPEALYLNPNSQYPYSFPAFEN